MTLHDPLPTLFDPAPRPLSLRGRFDLFHLENPHVLGMVVENARRLKAAGHTKGAIGMVWERLRWIVAVEVRPDGGDFRLNDHYRAFYARLAMETAPDLAGFFDLRKSAADVS